MTAASPAETHLEAFDLNRGAILSDYLDLLRFETIGTELRCRSEMERCAAWLQDFLCRSGMRAEVWEIPGRPPVVFGSSLGQQSGTADVLLYGHYDVQPVEPLSAWRSPPFEPVLCGDVVYARGAQDNKGQMLYTLHALRRMLKAGQLPCSVKICIEGEEECGSGGLQSILESRRTDLAARHLVVVDSAFEALDKPSLSLGARGSTFLDIRLTGPKADLHSGIHGGLAYNPARALAEALGRLHDAEGRVTVPGFYDDVREPTPEELAMLDLSFDAAEYQSKFGGEPNGGEKRYPPRYANVLRPTVEINGLLSGYCGEGMKTIIPSQASAKLSARLVPDQDPERVAELLSFFVRSQVPSGIQVDVFVYPGGKAVRSRPDTRAARAAAAAFEELTGRPCRFTLDGFTIPVAAKVTEVLGCQAVLLGLGLPEDDIHAPNEKFDLGRMRLGYAAVCRFLELYSSLP